MSSEYLIFLTNEKSRHYREWGLMLVFDENIDMYDEVLEVNSAALAVRIV